MSVNSAVPPCLSWQAFKRAYLKTTVENKCFFWRRGNKTGYLNNAAVTLHVGLLYLQHLLNMVLMEARAIGCAVPIRTRPGSLCRH